MNTSHNQPEDDHEKLERLSGLLDRLTKAGFIKSHGHRGDVHLVECSESGWCAVRAVQSIEASIPDLSDADRFGIWNILRMASHYGGDTTAPHRRPVRTPPSPPTHN